MSAFLPVDHVFVEHEYSAGNWQDVTGLVTLALNLREFEGQHTAGITCFPAAALDPARGSGTRILKQGDRVRISMHNAAATVRRTGTFTLKRVATAIDLKKPPGRRYLVTIELRGNGVAGVAGVGASKGVDTIDDLSDVITGAPFEIGGDGYGSGRTTAIGTSTEVAVTDVASELDQVLITKDSNPGVMAFEDPYGTIQVFDSRTQRTGAATFTLGPANYSDIDVSFDTTHVINVVHIKYLKKVKASGSGKAGKATSVVEHDVTYTTNDATFSAKFYAGSIGRYGRRAPAKPHVVHEKSNFRDYADDVFTANAWPDEVPRSVTVPIRKASELLGGYEDGHYVTKKVDVVSPDGLTTWTCRIARITHTISNRRWVVQVFLRPPTAVKHRKAPKATEVGNNVDGTILTEHLDDEAVTNDKVAGGAIDNRTLDDDAVDTRVIGTGAVDYPQLASAVAADIVAAQDAADDAQDTADGKATVTYSTGNPTGTPNDGDVWFKRSGTIIIGQWVGSAGSWVSVTVSGTVIAALDAGKITTGTLTGIDIIGAVFETSGSGNRVVIEENNVGGVSTGQVLFFPQVGGGVASVQAIEPSGGSTDGVALGLQSGTGSAKPYQSEIQMHAGDVDDNPRATGTPPIVTIFGDVQGRGYDATWDRIGVGSYPSGTYADGSSDGAGTSPNYSNYQDLWHDLLPIGVVLPYAGGTSPPDGFLYCNGQAVSRTTYRALFTFIGTTYGAGNGTTTFNVPDLRDRFIIGGGTWGASGTSEGSANGSARVNRQNHTHDHTIAGQAADGSPQTPGTASGSVPRNNQYGGHAHGGSTGSASAVTGGTIHAQLALDFIIRSGVV